MLLTLVLLTLVLFALVLFGFALLARMLDSTSTDDLPPRPRVRAIGRRHPS
jgi:hypothetical protein